MPVVQLPLLAPAHRNQQLFSDYYLNTILPERADWQLATLAGPVMREIALIFAAYKPSSNEVQTEDGLIKPVLAALGHSYEVQAALKTPDGTKKPDYVFYRDLTALHANRGKTLDDRLIVKYIVDQTVGPALRRAIEGAQDDAARARAVLSVNVIEKKNCVAARRSDRDSQRGDRRVQVAYDQRLQCRCPRAGLVAVRSAALGA
jgi:hypothetical protein